MVILSQVIVSNLHIPSSLPKQLVAVFAGAKSDIGEATLKALVKYAVEPRIYLFARNQTSAERVIAECRQINPEGNYILVQVDLSLIKETDVACEVVKNNEKLVNLVVLSAGEFNLERNLMPEGLHVFLAASTYTRIRIAQNLLPLLVEAASATPLARVLNVAGGTHEGDVNISDLPALKTPLMKTRPHVSSMHTLSLEVLAQQAPTVSFVHGYPGTVYTNLGQNATGVVAMVFRIVMMLSHAVLGSRMFVHLQECGKRHVFLATSTKYAPRVRGANGVSLQNLNVATGTDGVLGSGTYSVSWDGEKGGEESVIALDRLRRTGVKEIVWDHITGEFARKTDNNGPPTTGTFNVK